MSVGRYMILSASMASLDLLQLLVIAIVSGLDWLPSRSHRGISNRSDWHLWLVPFPLRACWSHSNIAFLRTIRFEHCSLDKDRSTPNLSRPSTCCSATAYSRVWSTARAVT